MHTFLIEKITKHEMSLCAIMSYSFIGRLSFIIDICHYVLFLHWQTIISNWYLPLCLIPSLADYYLKLVFAIMSNSFIGRLSFLIGICHYVLFLHWQTIISNWYVIIFLTTQTTSNVLGLFYLYLKLPKRSIAVSMFDRHLPFRDIIWDSHYGVLLMSY